MLLDVADRLYLQAESLASSPRIEMLCPWAAVLIERGQRDKARQLLHDAARIDNVLLREYIGKYPSLADHVSRPSNRKDSQQ